MAARNIPKKQKNDQQEANRQQRNQQENGQQDRNQAAELYDTPSAALDAAMPVNLFHQANFEALSQAVILSVQGMMAVQEELLKFAVSRMNKDMQMAQSLMSGSITSGMWNGQSEYWREMMQDYADGSQKIMERALQLAKESATPLEERIGAAAQEVKPERRQVAAK